MQGGSVKEERMKKSYGVVCAMICLFLMASLLGSAVAKETVITVGVGAETVGFDPHNTVTNESAAMNAIVYDFLVTFDQNLCAHLPEKRSKADAMRGLRCA